LKFRSKTVTDGLALGTNEFPPSTHVVGIAEGLLAGITSFGDVSDSGASLDALLQLGVRGRVYQEVFVGRRPATARDARDAINTGDFERHQVTGEMPLKAELRDFLAHLAGGPPPRASAAGGALVVERIDTLRRLAGVEDDA